MFTGFSSAATETAVTACTPSADSEETRGLLCISRTWAKGGGVEGGGGGGRGRGREEDGGGGGRTS